MSGHVDFPELDEGFEYDGEYNDMSQPIRCSYQEYRDGDYETYKQSFIGEVLDKEESMTVEVRGITLRQLRAVMACVKRMCDEGTMMSTFPGKPKEPITDYETVSLYDINANIILPYTSVVKKSFVERLPSTAGTQPPRWFLSHFWGEQFVHTMSCIETLYEDFADNIQDDSLQRGGGMTLDSPIWICAFANNQHDLSDITEDPAESGFARALKVASYRTASILDAKGIVFTRVWCVEELYLTHIVSQEQKRLHGTNAEGIWAVYTAFDHENDDGEEKTAVGIVSGGTTADGKDGNYIAAREAPFPMNRILASRNVNIQTAQASVESDRRHILNSIVKRDDLNADPLEEHENYGELNNAVRGAFACSLPALRGSYAEGPDQFEEMLELMHLSNNRNPMRFNFEDEYGWHDLESEDAIKLIQHLPDDIGGLEILYAPFGAEFFNAVSQFISERATNLEYLEIWHSTSNADEEQVKESGVNLAEAIGNCKTIKKLELFQTELIGSLTFTEWEAAFQRNQSLEKVLLNGLNNYVKEDVEDAEDAREDCFSEEDEDSETEGHPANTVENPDDYRMRILWKDGTFPNATMSEEEIEKLQNASNADIEINDM